MLHCKRLDAEADMRIQVSSVKLDIKEISKKKSFIIGKKRKISKH